ncbi:hypothetical protein RHSIM_RhsimUnG0227200 [Rhododendron simsii]|uniref:Uncharacterized protein n=1 Tax=Rhododendron simsii TaxID=118357 RepID=A0A834L3E2_RHOSS|nr:hypothetical protein RHSIM_RhsimUnG0227200 [Rhododendron simsii]
MGKASPIHCDCRNLYSRSSNLLLTDMIAQELWTSIGEVLGRCPAITQLHTNGIEVSDVFGCCSDHSAVNLKTLKARHAQINDKGMAMIGNRCRNLQYWDIACCENVTDKGFDPDAGTPEEREAVEKARDDYQKNKSQVRAGGDVLMRLQV